jgi:hypothetical protein
VKQTQELEEIAAVLDEGTELEELVEEDLRRAAHGLADDGQPNPVFVRAFGCMR